MKARVDATTVIDNARSMADKLLDEARLEARRSAESERIKAENEVQALLARRDFLLSDVDHLEHHLGAQRERLRDAAVSLQDLIERVPGGLGDMRRPLLSASAENRAVRLASQFRGLDRRREAPAEIDEVGGDDNAFAGESGADDETDPDSTSSRRSTMRHRAQIARYRSPTTTTRALVMRLELGSLDVDRPARPSWSAAGDDPLIGGDELQ